MMFEYAIEILNEEKGKIYAIKRGCPTPSKKEYIKYDFALIDIEEAIEVLEKAGRK